MLNSMTGPVSSPAFENWDYLQVALLFIDGVGDHFLTLVPEALLSQTRSLANIIIIHVRCRRCEVLGEFFGKISQRT